MGFRLNKCFRLKSQVAMEFIMLILLAFMIMMIFTIVGRDKMVDLRREEEYIALKDVSLTVQSEIFIAANVESGYIREFDLPDSLDGINYTIGISGAYLISESENHDYTLRISSVAGNIIKGANVIRNEEGVVHLNE